MTKGPTQSYSHLADTYDEKRFQGESGRFTFETDRALIVDWVTEADARRVLDVPVGTGRVLVYLQPLGCEVIGLDYTEEMLERARQVADPATQSVTQGDASAMSFDDGAFDCLISLRFFHLFKSSDREPFAREFRRVVRPGGHVIVSFTNGWYAGGLNWLKKSFGLRTVEFGYPFEVSALFPGWEVVRVRGNYLPKQWRLQRVPILGRALATLTRVPPVNRFCWETFYLLRKPASG